MKEGFQNVLIQEWLKNFFRKFLYQWAKFKNQWLQHQVNTSYFHFSTGKANKHLLNCYWFLANYTNQYNAIMTNTRSFFLHSWFLWIVFFAHPFLHIFFRNTFPKWQNSRIFSRFIKYYFIIFKFHLNKKCRFQL